MNVVELGTVGALAALAVMDVKKKMIPVLPVIVFGIMLLAYRVWTGVMITELLLGVLPGVLLLFLSVCSRGSIGMGDGIVLCAIGIGCGQERTIAILGLAFILAAVLAMVLLVTRKANRKTELPFIPCVFFGYALCFMMQ